MLYWFTAQNIFVQLLLVYLVLINTAAFFYFGIDKLKAQFARRRVPETTLWLLALCGGSVGALLGMHFFHHKVNKPSFHAWLALIIALQAILITLLVV